MFALIQESAAYGSEQALAFLGRLHPLLLHLPIGLFAASALFEMLGWFKSSLRPARRWSNVALALSAAIAAGSGYLLGGEAGYEGELVDDHRMFGILVGVFAGLLALSELRATRVWTVARLSCFTLCAATLYLAGHHGGQITHGPTFLSEHAPDWLAAVVGPHEEEATPAEAGLTEAVGEPRAAEAMDPGAAAVVATLTARCIQCHGPNKVKGNLRLDRADGLLSVVEPGGPEESELLRRVLLPRSDAKAMPPKGAALVAEEIDAIEAWIAAGAPLESVEAAQAREAELELAAREHLESARRASGAKIEPLAQDLELPTTEQRLEVTWLPGARAAEDGASYSALAPVAERIVSLRLPQQALSEIALIELPRLPRLERLSLMGAQVSGATLETLADKSPDLRHLNLFGVEIDAFPAAALDEWAALDRLVLSGTGLTRADFDAYRDARLNAGLAAPDCEVVLDAPALTNPLDTRPPRRLLAADASTKRIALLSELVVGRPEVIWEHPIEQLHDFQWLGDTTGHHGRVLFQDRWTHLLEVDTATGEVLWEYDAATSGEGPVEIHGFRRLDDGSTWVAESGRSRLVRLDSEAQVVEVVELGDLARDAHHGTRLMRPTPDGTFLLALEQAGRVVEVNTAGEVLWSYSVPLFDRERAPGHGPEAHGNQAFGALRLADGDTLITTGNGSSLIRVRPNGSLRWHLGQHDLPGLTLAWTTTIQELSTGHLVLGNCHAGPDQPQAVELTPEGVPVWTFKDHERFGNALSNFEVIEAAP